MNEEDKAAQRSTLILQLGRVLAPVDELAEQTSPPPGAPLPPHEKGNRRVGNRRMREDLRFEPVYERFDAGIRASTPR